MNRFRLPAVAAVVLLVSSNVSADLRTFEIAPQYQQEVFAALRDILTIPAQGFILDARGRVELLPSGQILVNASAETLEQVDQVLQVIQSRAVDATPRITLRYWAVLGLRGQTDGEDAPGTLPAALADVLAELTRFHGDLSFRALATSALVTQSGQPGEVGGGEVGGMTLDVEQTAYVQGDTLNAEIEMELRDAKQPPAVPAVGRFEIGTVRLRTTLARGEFVVLGEGQLQGGGLDGPVFYIVHWAQQ